MRRVLTFGLAVLAAASVLNADMPQLPTKKISVGPIDITLGFDKGLGGTAKGEYVSAIGEITDANAFAPGYTLNLDAAGNTSSKKADNATLAGGIGWVSVDPSSFYPKFAAFLQAQAKTGQVEKTSGSGFDRVNQVVIGATVEYVPQTLVDFVTKGHSVDPAKISAVQLRCSVLTEDEACKKLLEDLEKSAGKIEAPPFFSAGYFHPLRTSGGDAGDLPNGIEANKITVEFVADNHLPGIHPFGKPLHVTANLSATYPMTGSDKKLQGKIDVGVGLDLTSTFTPILKYVSGEKDGFTYDKSVLVGFLFDLAKLRLK
jgi:hypothetical protein